MVSIKTKHERRLLCFVIIGLILCILIIGICMVLLLQWINDSNNTKKEIQDIYEKTKIEEKEDSIKTELINSPVEKESDYWYYIKMNLFEVNFTNLLQINPDTVGWIKVENTHINYPIVQTTNNLYYLSHSFKQEKNQAGWIFMDYRNDSKNLDKNTIIYAHNRYDSTMFGTLKNVLTDKWLSNRNNYVIRVSTPTENSLWQVFSVYTVKKESYYISTNFNSIEEYDQFLNIIKNRSIYNFDTLVNINDKILTLSTCQDNNGNRVVVHAKLIKKEVR